MLLDQLPEAVERAKAVLSLKELFRCVLAGLCGRGGLPSSLKFMKGRMYVDGVRVFEEVVRRMFVNSG